MEKKSNHQANIVRVGEILVHPNADNLQITRIGGYQCVIGKNDFQPGELAVFIQPDSVVPQTEPFRFIWNDHVGPDGLVPESRRRVIPRRFRKEWSEGLLMPVTVFNELIDSTLTRHFVESDYPEGTDVSDLLGITHWVPAFDKESTVANVEAAPRAKYPKTLKGWFFWSLWKMGLRFAKRSFVLEVTFDFPKYDVDAWKNHADWIPDGTVVQVTEKIHGSNMRAVFIESEFYVGSHLQWVKKGDNVWWNAVKQHPEIEEWCRANPGLVLYGEVGPTQSSKKDKRWWRYGCESGETFFFAYHVYESEANNWHWPGNLGFGLLVPVIYFGSFSRTETPKLADGPTIVLGAVGPREGCVVRVIGTPERDNLKIVSNAFLEGDK